jgi:hypothetical protein
VSAENEKPLCLQPMTHGDGRYAEGRRAGLLEGRLETGAFVREVSAEAIKMSAPIGVVTAVILATLCDKLDLWAGQKAGEP